MTWPAPQPGLVIRYSYLWTREAETGREEGAKDRPCAIILAVADERDRTRVIVLPITPAAPQPPDEGIELPQPTKARLGLDSGRSWIIVTEGNDFIWPGPDLRPLAEQGPGSVAYGFLPPRLFRAVRERFLAHARTGRAGIVKRTL
ncbi:MAG TPA: hypothetical protein VJ770_27185 [Stellaceae bacterium]|nr:hypothetical protein [Stellaceae bacterium]